MKAALVHHGSTLSARWTVALLVLALATASVVVPLILHKPRWIEALWALTAWWAIWSVALTVLLFRGKPLDDDWKSSETLKSSTSGGMDIPDLTDGCSPAASCIDELVIAVVAFLAVVLVWLFIELVAPSIAILVYVVCKGMVNRAMHAGDYCRGKLAPSLAWGIVWATIYTGPLTGIVCAVHVVSGKR